MKAVTPVLALVMLMLITVGLVGTAYVWFGNILSGQTGNSISVPPGGIYCKNGEITAHVLNIGDSNLKFEDFAVAQIDGNDLLGTPYFFYLTSGLVGYWRMDDGSGLTAKDHSGNSRNGNLNSMDPATDWVAGKFGGALDFDGTNDHVNIGDFLETGNGRKELTVIMLVKTGVEQNQKGILAHYDYGINQRSWELRTNSAGDGKFAVIVSTDGTFNAGKRKYYVSNTVFIDNSWHQIGFTFNSGTLKLYLDGSEVTVTKINDDPITTIHDSTAGITIGSLLSSGASADNFNGVVDEIRIFNKVLSDTEISNEYRNKHSDLEIAPQGSKLAISYPAALGLHDVRIGTSSNVVESKTTCN
ncbi:MAG: LamG domain-containing protein [Candidatus Aenigmarchaeota archaeon]|nr:LamG domain-containing protein [Candidatus Aenigmarchaeota archaeon]